MSVFRGLSSPLYCRLLSSQDASTIGRRNIGATINLTCFRRFSDKRRLPQDPHPNTPLGKLDRTPQKDKNDANCVASTNIYTPFADGKNPLTGEVGGPAGPEPTRYGDWERKGRVSDF